jgi:hypothetical protein
MAFPTLPERLSVFCLAIDYLNKSSNSSSAIVSLGFKANALLA